MPRAGQGQTEQRIAAVVNDELITAYDLEARMKLVIVSTRLPNTFETRRRISGQVLRTLIDERLKMQEAKRRNISVSNREVLRAKANIEKQNQLPKNGLDQMLQQNHVPLEAMEEQLRSAIAWSKLLSRRLRPRITIGEEEIDETLNGSSPDRGKLNIGCQKYYWQLMGRKKKTTSCARPTDFANRSIMGRVFQPSRDNFRRAQPLPSEAI